MGEKSPIKRLMNIKITRLDGGLHIAPAPPYITNYLKYQHRSMEIVKYKRVPVFHTRLLHEADGDGGVYTLQGYFEYLCRLIHKHMDTYTVDDARTPLPAVDWPAIKAVGPKGYQIPSIVDAIAKGSTNSGIIKAAGGWGKTYGQMFMYGAWNNLNTILAIPLKQVFLQTYAKFKEKFPNKHIGRVGDGHFDISDDITITTFRSLPKCALEKCQLLLVDELQACTGDQVQDTLAAIKPIRVFGFTATDEGLFNNADKVLKGLFGERLIHIPYDDALNVGAVVPAVVYFVDVPDTIITAQSFEGVLSQGIKRCKVRNQLIGKICTKVPNNWATLVFVDHINDHLVELYKYMPAGTKYLHRETSKTKMGTYALSAKQQNEIIDDFSNNKFQYLIATDAFRAGVDIPHLRVVIQAAGGCSEVEVIQEALRGSRTLPENRQIELDVEPKTHFVLIDFMDNHDDKLHNMAKKRMELYEKQGWEIRRVKSVDEIKWDYDKINTSLQLR